MNKFQSILLFDFQIERFLVVISRLSVVFVIENSNIHYTRFESYYLSNLIFLMQKFLDIAHLLCQILPMGFHNRRTQPQLDRLQAINAIMDLLVPLTLSVHQVMLLMARGLSLTDHVQVNC